MLEKTLPENIESHLRESPSRTSAARGPDTALEEVFKIRAKLDEELDPYHALFGGK